MTAELERQRPGAQAMTKRERLVRPGYIDETVVEKLMSGFASKMEECLPTGIEIMTAAMRELMLGLHVDLTNGDPSATTPEIQAKLNMVRDALCKLIQAAVEETSMAADELARPRDKGAKP
jgi:hypothetical protein